VITLTYPDKMISCEGKSDSGMKYFGRDRRVLIQGTEGSVIMAVDGYEVYDLKGKLTDEFKAGREATSSDLRGQDEMTNAHFANLIAGIKSGEALHSPIAEINVTITSLQLANLAWILNRELKLDTSNGHVVNDAEATKAWLCHSCYSSNRSGFSFGNSSFCDKGTVVHGKTVQNLCE
jgi:hypothetical protein